MPADLEVLARRIATAAEGRARFVVGIAGPPASGKSTLAETLAERIGKARAAVVPMDGFHYDDAVLAELGLSQRKGAPETFDYGGFAALLGRLRAGEDRVAVPVFDRSMELARAGARLIPADLPILLVEGNYLLLDEAPWQGLEGLFDMTVFLDVPEAELDRRLVERWRFHGREDEAARRWIDGNDLPNIRRVLGARRKADWVV
ncbi:MAG: nucleoside/nucleotide kinase family protein [Mesorhizobium amorphae]|nr:MAG: nucleoside/nucleotide kinase family protein [Mesorhizobium amorphae]